MTNAESPEWGPNLYAYLEQHWRATGTNSNAWAYEHGIQGPNLTRWKAGTAPGLPAFSTVAKALDMSLLDVLMIAGVITKDDVNRPVPEPPTASVSVDVAIETDPSLTDWQRKNLRDILASFRAVAAGVEVVEVRPGRRRKTQES